MNRVQRIMGHLNHLNLNLNLNSETETEKAGSSIRPAPTNGILKAIRDRFPSIPVGGVVETERHGGHLVAKVLAAHGVKWIFTLVGGHISPILIASKHEGIRVVDVRHEVTSVFAADAVARLTGEPGVAAVTAGPGITNTITAVKNASMAQSPLVLLGGAAPSLTKGRGALQEIDQLSVLKPIVKYAASVTRVRDIVPILRRAFQEAQSGVPGPVFVEFPLDVLYPMPIIRANMDLSSAMKKASEIKDAELKDLILPEEAAGLSARQYLDSKSPASPVFVRTKSTGGLISSYMQYKLNCMFGGAFDHTEFGPLKVQYPAVKQAQLNKAAQYLREAKRPVLVVASQALLHGKDGAYELKAAIEKLGIPTFLGGMARGLLGRNSKYHIRQNRTAALKKADLIFLAGTIADFRLSYGRSLGSKARIVSINRSYDDATKNAWVFWSPSLICQSDPSDFVIALSKATKPTERFSSWCAQLKESELQKEKANGIKARELAVGHGVNANNKLINPLELFIQLEKVLPENSILVADGGDFVATGSYILRPRGPLQWLDPGAFGTLGVGGGFALGAKLARPDCEVWIIWGDGSAGYSIAEFDTFKRHNTPVIGVIGNDACWTQIARDQVPMFGDDVATPLEYCNYEVVAQGYGGDGMEVKEGEGDELVAVFKQAQNSVIREKLPYLLNMHIGKSNFREGSISV